ncbi:DUF202 domain-containing protein [Conexibacter sp. SYSU D00693]|uniref:DUF202 domain-containing protein n=1 Tax=Conexibacter sp. SYSU D00693 TaxID=2812560 RepID=UPI00196B4487|nr:DUF202 domain-containing protein [Conexibacter sp. SYSU D00693]
MADVDARFSLANERTYLAWIRTALALLAGGVAAAKAIEFDHEVWRWAVAAPPIAGGGFLGAAALRRWRTYEAALEAGRPLPVGRGLGAVSAVLAAYAVLVLVATVAD